MTNRRLAVLVGIAVVGGAAVAGVGLATQSSPKPRRVLQIDEVNGRVGRVVLGETAEDVVGALGPPGIARESSFFYRYLYIGFRQRRVALILTNDPTARTEQSVRIGDPLSAARASYRKAAKCNPNSPDKTAKHPHCVVKVPSGTLLIGGDPIRSMTLERG
jgi:hypothetical protein